MWKRAIRRVVPDVAIQLLRPSRSHAPPVPPSAEEQRKARLNALFGGGLLTDSFLPGKVLEVGPSLRPMAPRRAGFDVTIVDHLDHTALREKYKDTDVDLDIIEDVDHVWSGQSLPDLVGAAVFDWAIAAHVGEHTPDLVQFLNDFGAVLTPTGRLGLVLPDKRFCFDIERPSASLARVIDAHERGDIRPSVGAVAEHCIYARKRNGGISWIPQATGELEPVHTIDQVHERIDLTRAGEYKDVHVWCFTMDEFGDLINKLVQLDFLDVEIAWLHQPTDCTEFYVEFVRRT